MNKKVYTSTDTVKDINGNVVDQKIRNIVVNKEQEKFIMVTTTNGMDWVHPVRNYLAFLIYLSTISDNNGMVALTPYRKAEIQVFFKWKNKVQVDNALGVLLKNDCIKRVGRGDYIINPDTVFQGGTIKKVEKLNLYKSIV